MFGFCGLPVEAIGAMDVDIPAISYPPVSRAVKGQALVEYALILGVIFCIAMIVVGVAQDYLKGFFFEIVKMVDAL